MQEANRDRADALGRQLASRRAHGIFIEGPGHSAIRRLDPFWHRQPQTSRHKRMFLPGKILVEAEVERAFVPRDMKHVAKAFGGDQTNSCATALKYRVGCHCRAMENEL